MYLKYFTVFVVFLHLAACSNNAGDLDTVHEDLKVSFTAYSDSFELFAEADPFVTGVTSNVLSHFSTLPDFNSLDSGTVTLKLIVSGQTTEQTLEKPTRRGIYSFDITPAGTGTGVMEFVVRTASGEDLVIVPDVTVYADSGAAVNGVKSHQPGTTNTSVFTKEQSWKIDFSTGYPRREPFGKMIRATALVQPAKDDEVVVAAKTGGTVSFTGNFMLEGTEVLTGQALFMVKGSGFAEENSAVRFAEAQNNYKQAEADFERAGLLAADKIVSERQLLEAKTRYENAKSVFESLQQNLSPSGQAVTSPMTGFVRQLLVENGQYVETGQPLMVISKNRTLLLRAEVQQSHARALNSILTATIRSSVDNKIYTLEELGGKVLSVGKASSSDSYLIPVSLQINNRGDFVPGSFVELWLKTVTDMEALTIPVSSIIEEQGSFFVFVQVTPERFEKRLIQTGATDGIRTEVTGGLKDDERIVTEGAINIKLAQATGALDAHSGHVH